MPFAGISRSDWQKLSIYGQFERIALGAVLLVLSLIIVYALVASVIKLIGDFALGELFLDKAALQDTFGLVLTVVILLEFNHSIYVALAQRSGAIQTQSVVLIVILVLARKLMLKDIDALDLIHCWVLADCCWRSAVSIGSSPTPTAGARGRRMPTLSRRTSRRGRLRPCPCPRSR